IGDLRNACAERAAVAYDYFELGAYGRAERIFREALITAERLGLATESAAIMQNLSMVLCRIGSVDEGLASATRSVEISRLQGHRRVEGGSRTYLAQILARVGRLEDAEGEAKTAIEVSDAYPAIRAHALAALAEVRLKRGKAGEALD